MRRGPRWAWGLAAGLLVCVACADATLLKQFAQEDINFATQFPCVPETGKGGIEGTVLDATREFGIFGADVLVTAPTFTTQIVETGAEGEFVLCDLEPQAYHLVARAAGYTDTPDSQKDVTVQVGGLSSVELRLALANQEVPETEGSITGTVRDAQSSNPIKDATVTGWKDVKTQNGLFADGNKVEEVKTNENGTFFLTMPTGTYTLTVSAEDFRPILVSSVTIRGGQTVALDKDLLLRPE